MRILIAGPDSQLEFGWKLMMWIPKLRKLSEQYGKTFIVTPVINMPLYSDFAYHIDEIEQFGYKPNMWRFSETEVDYIHPTKEFCCNSEKGKAYKYGDRESFENQKIICVHPRKKNDKREWPVEKWIEFINKLRIFTDMEIVSVGLKSQTHTLPKSIRDCRGKQFNSLFRLLDDTKLIVGPSSGMMHLASLCGCPALVWTDNKRWNLGSVKGTNRERYEWVWNPLKTPVTVIDEKGWNPPVGLILSKTKEHII